MHGSISSTIAESSSEDVIGEIAGLTDRLPQIELSYEADIRTLWITLKPEPKPVFTLPVIRSVLAVQRAIMRRWGRGGVSPIQFFAYRARGPIFSLGGDLDFYLDCLRDNNREGLHEYARVAADVICCNDSGLDGRVITLAAIQGKAVGGGIDPARACNVLIAGQSASFSYPEINYNHFPISALPVLSRHASPRDAKCILMSGDDYTAAQFEALGVLDAVVPDGEEENWIRRYAAQNAFSHSARITLFEAFNRQAGSLAEELALAANIWADHMIRLKPLAISKLQRIVQAQERMLSRMKTYSAVKVG